MKVKMRSQVAVEKNMARKGKLADDINHKEIWMKRDMNIEEREKEKLLSEAKEKKREKDRNREEFLLEGSGYETKEVVSKKKRGGRGGSNKLRVTYTNIDGLLSST